MAEQYQFDDVSGETISWPSGLSYPELAQNFDIQSLAVSIGAEMPSIEIHSLTLPVVQLVGPTASLWVGTSYDGTVEATVNITATNAANGNHLHWEEKTVEVSRASSAVVDVVLPYSFLPDILIRIEWRASWDVGGASHSVYYTDQIITSDEPLALDPQGRIIIIDNLDDHNSTISTDWGSLAPEYNDSVLTSSDGKFRFLVLNFTIHHSPLELSLEAVPYVDDIDVDSLPGMKMAGDMVLAGASLAKTPAAGTVTKLGVLENLGVVSAGIDVSYVTLRGLNCELRGESCPKDDWEALDMFITFALGAAVLTGTVLMLSTSPAWASAGTAILTAATVASLAYNTGKLVASMVQEAMEGDAGETEQGYRTIGQRSLFMQPDPSQDQMYTGLCDVIGTCSNEDAELIVDDFSAELMEKFPDQNLSDLEVVGFDSAPLSNYMDGQPEGTLHFIEVKNKVTNERTIRPIMINFSSDMLLVYHGEMPQSSQQNYELRYDSINNRVTMGNPPFDSGSGNMILMGENTGGGDLDLHAYVGDAHIGLDRDTGQMENQVIGAWCTGDVDTSRWLEMIWLPEQVTDCRMVVDAEEAKDSVEDYFAQVKVIREDMVVASVSSNESIQEGTMDEFRVNISESAGQVEIDTDLGAQDKEGLDPIIILLVVVAAVVILALVMMLLFMRRRAKRF
jgi:hypothetical protein